MKHAGKARKAAVKLILISLVLVVIVLAFGLFAAFFGGFVVAMTPILLALWALFALFTLYFFRDPNPAIPTAADAILSPANGKVDVIEEFEEPAFMGAAAGESRSFCRCSMFTSNGHPPPAAWRTTGTPRGGSSTRCSRRAPWRTKTSMWAWCPPNAPARRSAFA